jgi:probable rRNA maturation factor
VKVTVFNRQKSLPIQRKQVKEIVALVLDEEKVFCDEVALYFVKKKEISSLHEEFFDDPSPTDCISFPLDTPLKEKKKGHCFLGEIFVCSDVAVEYAKSHKKDPSEELNLYLVHGLLHLIGYRDKTPQERRVMRKKEKSCMNLVKKFLKSRK